MIPTDPHNRPARARDIPPISMRFSVDEYAALTREARGQSLGLYCKAKVLGAPPVRLRRSAVPVEDRAALAAVLARLGQSQVPNNLNQMVRLAHSGSLPLNPETFALMTQACRYVAEIRALTLKALGRSGDGA